MKHKTMFYIFLAFCLLNQSNQISFKAVNDPFHFLSLKDLHDIQEDIKATERYSGLRITLFITNSLQNFRQNYRLNASFNVYDTKQFLNSLYNSMYPISSSGRNDILVMFSLDNRQYGLKLGTTANSKISTYRMEQFFEQVKPYFLRREFSKGIRKYIDEIEDYFEDLPRSSVAVDSNYSTSHNRTNSSGSGSAASLIIVGAILILVMAACCFGKNVKSKTYYTGSSGKIKRKGSGSSSSSKSNHNDDRYRDNNYGPNHDEYGNYDRGTPGYQDQGFGFQGNMGTGGGAWGGNDQSNYDQGNQGGDGGNWGGNNLNANYQGNNENQGSGGGGW